MAAYPPVALVLRFAASRDEAAVLLDAVLLGRLTEAAVADARAAATRVAVLAGVRASVARQPPALRLVPAVVLLGPCRAVRVVAGGTPQLTATPMG
jgi:hypothetical protein